MWQISSGSIKAYWDFSNGVKFDVFPKPEDAVFHHPSSSKTFTKTQWTYSEPYALGGYKAHYTWLGFGYWSYKTFLETIYSPDEILAGFLQSYRSELGLVVTAATALIPNHTGFSLL